MSNQALPELAEELLESLYIRTIENDEKSVPLSTEDAGIIEDLHARGAVLIESDRIYLSPSGTSAGRRVVRRHRLAERLLVDVLGWGESAMHEHACRFEHVLNDGLDARICTLLGHPRICPHGRPIPSGDCCDRKLNSAGPVVSPLSAMKKNEQGTVAYINPTQPEILNKLMAMGILPGAPIELMQSFPSYVFKTDRSQFAVDREIAQSINVRVFHA